MGAGASSHVKEIRIDQNDGSFNVAGGHRSLRSAPVSIGSAVAKKLRRSPGSGSKDRRDEQLRNGLEAAEKRANESQIRVRQLERELATIERRNQDLSEEVTWLKQQLNFERPEIPVPPRPTTSNSRPGTSGEGSTLRGGLDDGTRSNTTSDGVLRMQKQRLEEELYNLQSKTRKETQRLEAQMESMRRQMNEQVLASETKLHYCEKLNEQFEAIIKNKLSESMVTQAKASAEKASESHKRQRSKKAETPTVPNYRSVQIDKLNDQIDSQQLKIRRLEEEIIRRDIEIGHLKDLLGVKKETIGSKRSKSPPHDNQQDIEGTSPLPNSPLKKFSITSRPNSATSRHSFHAVKKSTGHSGHNALPMKADRKPVRKVEDEIEALLKSPVYDSAETNQEGTFGSTTRSLPPLPQRGSPNPPQAAGTFSKASSTNNLPKEQQHLDNNTMTKNKENIRVRSVAGMNSSASTTNLNSSLKNVYTLSESLEPQKILAEEQEGFPPRRKWSRVLQRPKTAAGSVIQQTAVAEVHDQSKNEKRTQQNVSLKDARQRGASAPMLYSSNAEEHDDLIQELELSFNSGKKRKHRRKKADDAEIMSISDMDDFDPIPPLEGETSCLSDTGAEILSGSNNEASSYKQTVPIRPASAVAKSRPPSSMNRTRWSATNPPLKAAVKNGSSASLYSSGAGTEEDLESTSDEEVKRILEQRQLGAQASRPKTSGQQGTGFSNQRQVPSSAKSRDSGFLGDSYPTNGTLWKEKELSENIPEVAAIAQQITKESEEKSSPAEIGNGSNEVGVEE